MNRRGPSAAETFLGTLQQDSASRTRGRDCVEQFPRGLVTLTIAAVSKAEDPATADAIATLTDVGGGRIEAVLHAAAKDGLVTARDAAGQERWTLTPRGVEWLRAAQQDMLS